MAAELFTAIEQHDLGKLSTLLAEGGDPNAIQAQWPGYTALQAAINELEDEGPLDALILLLDHGANVDGWDANRDATPLLMAVYRGQREAVRILLEAGADPNVRGSEGDSPLRWCAEYGDIETAGLLLRFGAEKTIDEFGGSSGYTALGLAASNLNIQMMETLLDAGADPEAVDEDYKTASERMPPRNASNTEAWDAAAALLGH